MECVPINISVSPDRTDSIILDFSRGVKLLFRHSIFTGKSRSIFLKVFVCWSARISVGTRMPV